jgi:hypothetical protein
MLYLVKYKANIIKTKHSGSLYDKKNTQCNVNFW